MTSANVIEYNIFDKNGKEVGHHRQHLMCSRNNDSLLQFIPASDFTIQPCGYDEEEEYWEDDCINLEVWLSKNKAEITSVKFNVGDVIYIKKHGKCKVLEFFDIFKKDKNWFPIYTVLFENGEIKDINQNDIKP